MKTTGIIMLVLFGLAGCESAQEDVGSENRETPKPQESANDVVSPETLIAEVPGDTTDADNLISEELAILQGEWRQISSKAFGAVLPDEVILNKRFAVTGNKKKVYTSTGEVLASGITIELDPTADPKSWDEKITIDSGEVLTFYGIYKLEEDTLTRCYAQPGGERPTEFVSPKGGDRNLQVFERVDSSNEE